MDTKASGTGNPLSEIVDSLFVNGSLIEDELPDQIKWEVNYEGNERGDGIRITAIFEPEDLDAVVASIRKQMWYWANEPKLACVSDDIDQSAP